VYVPFRNDRLSVSVCNFSRITKQVNCSSCVTLVFRPVCSNEFDNAVIERSVFERITPAVENFDEFVRIIIPFSK